MKKKEHEKNISLVILTKTIPEIMFSRKLILGLLFVRHSRKKQKQPTKLFPLFAMFCYISHQDALSDLKQ